MLTHSGQKIRSYSSTYTMQRGFIPLWLLGVLIVALGVGVYFFINWQSPVIGSETVCTGDMMKCPDGNWIQRTGSKCQFVCPAATSSSTKSAQ